METIIIDSIEAWKKLREDPNAIMTISSKIYEYSDMLKYAIDNEPSVIEQLDPLITQTDEFKNSLIHIVEIFSKDLMSLNEKFKTYAGQEIQLERININNKLIRIIKSYPYCAGIVSPETVEYANIVSEALSVNKEILPNVIEKFNSVIKREFYSSNTFRSYNMENQYYANYNQSTQERLVCNYRKLASMAVSIDKSAIQYIMPGVSIVKDNSPNSFNYISAVELALQTGISPEIINSIVQNISEEVDYLSNPNNSMKIDKDSILNSFSKVIEKAIVSNSSAIKWVSSKIPRYSELVQIAVERDLFLIFDVDGSKINREKYTKYIRRAVELNPKVIVDVIPSTIEEYEKLVLQAVLKEPSLFQKLSKEKIDKEQYIKIVERIIIYNPELLEMAISKLNEKEKKEVIIKVIINNSNLLKFVPENMDGYVDIIIELLKIDIRYINLIATPTKEEDYNSIMSILKEKINKNINSILMISTNNDMYVTLAKFVLENNPKNISLISPKTEGYDEMCKAAVAANPLAIKGVEETMVGYDTLVLAVIRKNPIILNGFYPNISKNAIVASAIEGIKDNPLVIKDISPNIYGYKEIMIGAVKANPNLIHEISSSVEGYIDIAIEAVRIDPAVLDKLNRKEIGLSQYLKIATEANKSKKAKKREKTNNDMEYNNTITPIIEEAKEPGKNVESDNTVQTLDFTELESLGIELSKEQIEYIKLEVFRKNSQSREAAQRKAIEINKEISEKRESIAYKREEEQKNREQNFNNERNFFLKKIKAYKQLISMGVKLSSEQNKEVELLIMLEESYEKIDEFREKESSRRPEDNYYGMSDIARKEMQDFYENDFGFRH